MAQGSQLAEKVKFLSFRSALRAEESLFHCYLITESQNHREIPRFARNDKIKYFLSRLQPGGWTL